MSVKEYCTNFSSSNKKECLTALSENEKALTSMYKRVLTTGKLSRSVVVLFPPNIRKYINFMVDIRNQSNLVPLENTYLFAYPGVHK